jgi:hypothetical protein
MKDDLHVTTRDFLIYKDDNNDVKIDVLLINKDIWLTQNLIAELFGVARSTITDHINNILNDGELSEVNTVGKTDTANSKKPVKIYNLDMIIAVGYRVNSKKATEFRIWATKILNSYMTKGFALDDERFLKGGKINKKYFDELLERIKVIRTSERMAYQKITDIFMTTSIDYDKNSEEAYTFFKIVQNKLHYAITGHTAAEIISSRADHEKNNMGLQTWKNSPSGKILKSDTEIAKNYLDKEELDELNSLVNMYLDYAELQAKRQKLMYMDDWSQRLDGFLDFNEYDILENGKISMKEAKEIANNEYDKFRPMQDKNYRSDFDKLLENIKEIK